MTDTVPGRHDGAQRGGEQLAPLVRAAGLTKAFGATIAVNGVDLEVERGQVVGVVGENGAGKTTLKNLLCGLFAPDAGTIELDGPWIMDAERMLPLAMARRHVCGLIYSIPVRAEETEQADMNCPAVYGGTVYPLGTAIQAVVVRAEASLKLAPAYAEPLLVRIREI
jgi:ABC-type Na+ transport system ATPase subunit NatA